MTENREIKTLLSLLDDDSDSVAVPVLAALLEHHTELFPYLAELQEHKEPAIRRRVHQLQSILIIRERRYKLLEKIENGSLSFPEYLLELHLQWFDCDAPDDVYKVYKDFVEDFAKNDISSVADAAKYMLKSGFVAVPDGSLDPEIYCLGPAVANRKIAESLLCGLLRYLLADPEIKVIYSNGHFALTDGKDTAVPAELWLVKKDEVPNGREFDDKMLLKFSLSMLFSHSVSQDHFRYVYTVGQALTGCSDDAFLDELPYPYCRLPEEYYEAQNNRGTSPQKGDIK